jgi:hypothetical protein
MMGRLLHRSRKANQVEHQMEHPMETTSHHHHLEHQACLSVLAAVAMILLILITVEVEVEVEVLMALAMGTVAVAAEWVDLKKQKSLPSKVCLKMPLSTNVGE